MHAAADRLDFAPPPTSGLLRALGLAILAHAFLLAALTWGVQWNDQALTITAEAELWSAVPQQAAPALVEPPPEPVVAPAPAPVAPPAPPAPQAAPEPSQADIALAREKQLKQIRQEKEQQRLAQLAQKKLLEKERLQEKLKQEKKAAEDKKNADLLTQKKDAIKAQQDARIMKELRDANLKRMSGLAGASGAADSSGTALKSAGPSSSYGGRISARIKPNIVFIDDIAGNPTAEIEVRTAPDGTILSRKLLKSSGVKSWDDAVLKAIDKTEKLPLDVDGRVPSPLTIGFRPKD